MAKIETTKWNYNAEDDVYWQVGISYCENPADEKYETLGIFVPGAYMNGVENADETYTCEVNTENTIGNYNAETAPIVIPVDTTGYSAMAAPTDYVASNANYTKDGIIYVSAGCRGKDASAPAGVTDLKAAIRYIRYSEESIPGSTDRIFSFGMSGGGAQSALIGATGDSELYIPYLEAIGAVSGVSDAVAGSMCWCPITNLDYANEAYEWNLGVTRTGLDEEIQKLSDEMSEAFAQYINELGLTDANGNVLVLTESEEGIYQAGSYYDYIKEVIENSLNNFLTDTTFPYEANNNGGFASGMMRGERPEELPDGALPEGGMKPDREGTKGEIPTGNQTQDITERDDIQRNIMSWYGFGSRVEWCACFVSWCANESGYIDTGVIPKFAGCVLGSQWFMDRGQWQDGSFEPSAGHIIFFDWEGDGVTDHVGIVEWVENGTVYTVEGNSGDSVRQNSYPIGSSVIYGYGISAY